MTFLPILTLLLLLPTIGVRAEEAVDEATPAKAIASLTDPRKAGDAQRRARSQFLPP